MFTGIIEALGTVAAIHHQGSDARLYVRSGALRLDDVQLGDSIAVNGVCLTAVKLPGDGFWADVSGETLQHTTLGQLHTGSLVNLEKALTLQTRLGGHLVSGHVDGVGVIEQRYEEGRSIRFEVRAPQALARYIAAKGSICVDGVSLTVNAVHDTLFVLNLVPHTLAMTTLNQAQAGCRCNVEVDLVARYLERLISVSSVTPPLHEKISADFLRQHGFA